MSYKILWIEDEVEDLMGMVTPLKKSGHNIVIAKNYNSALQIIDQLGPFDLIILDVIIPSGIKEYSSIEEIIQINRTYYGLKLLKNLEHSNSDMKIIVLSVVTEPEIVSQFIKSPLKVRYLKKGHISPLDLKKNVDEMMDSE
jgi:CheY-like chemotaxis protein